MSKPILGYWDLRGRAAPIRYLLHYKNVDFEDKMYSLGDFDSWFKEEKFTLGLDFPNLPYYIDGEVKLTQSIAILRYLAHKHGLAGRTEQERLRVSLVEQQLSQQREGLRNLCYNDEFDKLKPGFLTGLRGDLERLEAFIGEAEFMAGDEVTYVDFMAYELLDLYQYLVEDVFKDFPRLGAFRKRVRSLPSLEGYLMSSAYRRWPIFAPFASFGGKGPEPIRE